MMSLQYSEQEVSGVVRLGAPPPIINLTKNAVNKVLDFSQKMSESKGKFFRVFVEGGGCSGFQYGFNFDDQREGDALIDCGEVKVLLDPNSQQYVAGSVVDFVEDFKGSGFTVQNPKAKAHCGCGTSFTV